MVEPRKRISVPEAREIAVRAHADQRDRDGSFHIAHVARVAEGVPDTDEYQRVAWLHDVLEDSDIAAEELRDKLSAPELEALGLLTHNGSESYTEYVRRIIEAEGEAGMLARAVKQADMLDNLRRCAGGQDPAVAQYGEALGALWTAEVTRRRKEPEGAKAVEGGVVAIPCNGGMVEETGELIIRVASASDVSALAALRAIWSTGDPAEPGFERQVADWLAGEGDRRTTWLAWVGDLPVGMASMLEYRRMPHPGRAASRWGYVSNMFVLEDFRGRGIGSALLRTLVDLARARHYARLVLSPSQQATAFYRRAGFMSPDDTPCDRLLVRPRDT